MANGISIPKVAPGELIYLNLPLHPGSKLDQTPPTPPTEARKRVAVNMGFPGVEIVWKPGTDDNWISYYCIVRNGATIDKVAKGLYYFDHSAGADLAAKYEILTVDGAGNVSDKTEAEGHSAIPSTIVDDTADTTIAYTGNWEHKRNVLPAHEGTTTISKDAGAAAELTFDGRSVTLFSKLGPDCGMLEVGVDGGSPDVIDLYSADDIWGAGVYQKDLPIPGKHSIRITVLGRRSPSAKDSLVYLDAIKVVH
jgi:hypothetical protein